MPVYIGVLIVLIAFNAFFAGSELAFVSINNNKLKQMAEEGHKKAKMVLQLKENPNQFLSTIQIGVTLSSILSGAFASDAFAESLATFLTNHFALSASVVQSLSVVSVTILTTYLMLLFGELVPKRIALKNPVGFAFFVVTPIYYLSKITTPIVRFLSFSTNLMLRAIGIDPRSVNEEVTEEEIRIMVDAGEINLSEKEMINNIFDFDNQEVSDIMTHRTDVIGIDVESDFETIMNIIEAERFTRYPVYEGSIDNIIGIIHLRDLLRFTRARDTKHFNIREVMWKPYFVPDSKRTDMLFREFQNKKTHIAIAIDEYGGTAGLVTMEDLIEEIMGNIMDEYDEVEENTEIVEVADEQYLVGGLADLEELEDKLEIGLPVEDYDTLSGFMISKLGRIPEQIDVIESESDVVFNGYRFEIVELDEKIIAKVKISKEDPALIEEGSEESSN